MNTINCPKCNHSLEQQPGEMYPYEYYCNECNTGYQIKDNQLLAVGGMLLQGMGLTIHEGHVVPMNYLQPIIHKCFKDVFKSGFTQILKEKLGIEITPEIEAAIDEVIIQADKESFCKPSIDPSGHPVYALKQVCENNNIEIIPEVEKQLRGICDEPVTIERQET